jgi:hypothetical protein
MRSIRVFSASIGKHFGEQPENYGDNLMGQLLRVIYGIEVEYTPLAKAELIGIGSILDAYHRRKGVRPFRKRPWRTLHVWGSGFMNEDGVPFWPQTLKVHVVRGPLSREKLGLADGPMGDPALLVPRLWPKPSTSSARVSIVPHFVTFSDVCQKYGSALPRHWRIIDLTQAPQIVSNQIASSDVVVSSSLHGLIVADAYGIPTVRMAGDTRIKGDGFKYRDYEAFRGMSLGASWALSELLSRPDDLPLNAVPSIPPHTLDAIVGAFPFT